MLTTQMELTKLPYLRNLPLAHPVLSSDSFKISLLIGTDHYWDIVEDHIVHGQRPTAMSSKLGYLLSGPLPVDQTTSVTNTFHVSTCTAIVMNVILHSFETGISRNHPSGLHQ